MKTTKRLVSLALCLIFVFSLGISAFAETKGSTPYAGKVIKDNVRLRSGPGDGSSAGGLVQKGDTFYVYSTTGQWVYVYMTSGYNSGLNGYIHTSCVELYYY